MASCMFIEYHLQFRTLLCGTLRHSTSLIRFNDHSTLRPPRQRQIKRQREREEGQRERRTGRNGVKKKEKGREERNEREG